MERERDRDGGRERHREIGGIGGKMIEWTLARGDTEAFPLKNLYGNKYRCRDRSNKMKLLH